MRIYYDYLSTIEAAMKADPKSKSFTEGRSYDHRDFSKGLTYGELNKRIPKGEIQPSLKALAQEVGTPLNFDQRPGLHPDFAHLKYSNHSENHYIVSMFVDIKGSTNLFKRYTPETVLVITNTIQRAAIHTCLIFGGYVHRLQGDGLFIYFGGKQLSIKEAVQRSLLFSSVFTYFVKNDIKTLFEQQDIEPIYTRIGIDLGYEDDVVWALAGIGEISEVTTCSLHTSLASKMQSHAPSNGIVVGDHITSESLIIKELFTPVCHRTTDEKHRYIYQIPERKFNYTQHDFHWHTYLQRQKFIATDPFGNLQIKTPVALPQPHVTSTLASVANINKPYYE